jgi:hypothetical protein
VLITKTPLYYFLILASCVSCGTATPTVAPTPDVTPSRDVADVAIATDATSDEDVVPCSQTPTDARRVCVLTVRGRVVNAEGMPLSSRIITFCGPACFGSETDANGNFVVTVGDFLNPAIYAVQAHGRPEYGSVMIPAPAPVDRVITYAQPIVLPRYADMGPILPNTPTGGTFTAGDVTLTITPGTGLEFDVEDFDLGDLGRSLRSVYVTPSQYPPFAREAGVVALWALAPFNLISNRPIAVRVNNRAMLAPNAPVDFIVLGQEYTKEPFTAGQPIVAATGTVSADGMSVSTAASAGISYVTWIGIRPRR